MGNPIAEVITAADGYGLQAPIQLIALPGTGTNNQTLAFESPSGRFIWRQYQTHSAAETILYEHQLLSWLNRQELSFAVPAPLATRSRETLYRSENGYHALFPFVVGNDPDRKDPAMMEAVGAALGELHCALEVYPQLKRPGLDTYAQIAHVHPYLPDPASMGPQDVGIVNPSQEVEALFEWWRSEVDQVQQWKRSSYAALPRQVIHGDFTPANTLVLDDLSSGKRVSAILDFDFSLVDARAMDVAAGLYFTMRIWDNPNPWPVAEAFFRGYGRWVQLTDAEVAAIPWLMRLRGVVSTVWWFGKEAAAQKPVKLWRIEDLQKLVTWLDQNDRITMVV